VRNSWGLQVKGALLQLPSGITKFLKIRGNVSVAVAGSESIILVTYTQILLHKNDLISQAPVAHACNPS
jgi:hypothetical protein